MATILISGGKGFVGSHLCKMLRGKGYDVAILSRRLTENSEFKTYIWDPEKNEIDPEAIRTADYIIHLAGENIGEKRWTEKRKHEIIDSRIKSANVIFNKTRELNSSLQAFISASAVGYYGALTSEKIFNESDMPGTDFLSETCQKWEISADQFSSLGIRTVKIRTGIVLGKSGGMLSQLYLPVKMFLASPFGSGKQYMPWIHIDDLCGIYLKAIEDKKMNGAYNGVAPEHVTNSEFISGVAAVLNRPVLLFNIPSLVLKFIFGEMAVILLNGSRVSSEKIIKCGFQFKFPTFREALRKVYGKN